MNKKHILYAFTQNNLGDDIFIKILCQRYPNNDFYIGLKKEDANEALKNLSNLHFDEKLLIIDEAFKKESFLNNHLKINFNIIQKLYEKYIKSFDSSIYVIGSAFIQNNTGKDYTNIYLLDKRVKSANKFFLLNTNFGPYVDKEYLNYSKKIVSNMTHATFRDKFSYDLFKDLKNVSYAPDLVLTLKPTKKALNKTILISIMDLNEEYINVVSVLTNKLSDLGYECKLVSFCKNQGDETAANKIQKKLNKKIEILLYNGNLEDILIEFANATYIISTRFHSMIIAMALNKQFLPFVYSKKTNEVLEDIDYKGIVLDTNNLTNINMDECIDSLLNQNELNINEYKLKAENQFKALDLYLKDIYEKN